MLLIIIISACYKTEDDATQKARKIIEYNKQKFDNLPLSGKIVNGAREIEIKAIQYRWEPDTIVVKKGEKIKFIVSSEDSPHGFELEGLMIPELDTSKPIKKGDKIVAETTADQVGSWDMVCTVYCGPGHPGMRGKYIVRG